MIGASKQKVIKLCFQIHFKKDNSTNINSTTVIYNLYIKFSKFVREKKIRLCLFALSYYVENFLLT